MKIEIDYPEGKRDFTVKVNGEEKTMKKAFWKKLSFNDFINSIVRE